LVYDRSSGRSLSLEGPREERFMNDKEKRKKEAQEISNWAIMHLKGRIKCKVISYKYENYPV
jgi:hypothetical protein